MNRTIRRVLLSTALLATACTKKTDTPVPAAPATPPAATQPKPAAPAAPAHAVDKAATPEARAAAPSVADLGKLLSGIKDEATAKAAKTPLDAIVQQLQTTKNAAAPAAKPDALGGLGKMAGDAATKLGVSADTVKQIGTLLNNPSVKAVIGPTLEKLQSLLK
ncbi:MAG: hypothetical protein ABIP94_18990 [Planctomycetota bacterium]